MIKPEADFKEIPVKSPGKITLRHKVLDIDTVLEFTSILGRGRFGEVLLGKDKRTGKQHAVKVISKRNETSESINESHCIVQPSKLKLARLLNESTQDLYKFQASSHAIYFKIIMELQFKKVPGSSSGPSSYSDQALIRVKLAEREITILSMVNHPHIIRLDRVYYSDEKIFMLLELCHCELGKVFREKKTFTELEARHVIQDLASAVSYLHKNEIVHRDLKLENIMLATNPSDLSDNLYIKLADFGLSIVKSGSAQEDMLQDLCGTETYMSPEIVSGKLYSQQCDVWAMGVIMYLLLSGSFPFYSDCQTTLCDMIIENEPTFSEKAWKENVSSEAVHLTAKMLTKNPAFRITASEATQHPWVLNKKMNQTPVTNVLEMMKEWKEDINKDEMNWAEYEATKSREDIQRSPNAPLAKEVLRTGTFEASISTLSLAEEAKDTFRKKSTSKYANEIDGHTFRFNANSKSNKKDILDPGQTASYKKGNKFSSDYGREIAEYKQEQTGKVRKCSKKSIESYDQHRLGSDADYKKRLYNIKESSRKSGESRTPSYKKRSSDSESQEDPGKSKKSSKKSHNRKSSTSSNDSSSSSNNYSINDYRYVKHVKKHQVEEDSKYGEEKWGVDTAKNAKQLKMRVNEDLCLKKSDISNVTLLSQQTSSKDKYIHPYNEGRSSGAKKLRKKSPPSNVNYSASESDDTGKSITEDSEESITNT